MKPFRCPARHAPALLLACAFVATPAVAQTLPLPTEIDGRVVDTQTGLALAGASISVVGGPVGGPVSFVTDSRGTFRIVGLPPGTYALRIAHVGYQPSDADNITVTNGAAANVTLSLQAAPGATRLTTIGRSSTTLGGALQKAATSYRSLAPEALIESGVYRAGDALRGLPSLNNGITGDTAALGDDLQLDFRGIGTLETLATLDGHPIGYGVPGGYNYQLSPVAGLRNINVIYGSASNLAGYSAIGGTVDFQTLEPTPDERITLSQGYGTTAKRRPNCRRQDRSGGSAMRSRTVSGHSTVRSRTTINTNPARRSTSPRSCREPTPRSAIWVSTKMTASRYRAAV